MMEDWVLWQILTLSDIQVQHGLEMQQQIFLWYHSIIWLTYQMKHLLSIDHPEKNRRDWPAAKIEIQGSMLRTKKRPCLLSKRAHTKKPSFTTEKDCQPVGDLSCEFWGACLQQAPIETWWNHLILRPIAQGHCLSFCCTFQALPGDETRATQVLWGWEKLQIGATK